jgi:predicted GNAT family acetyltransferase
MDEVTVENNRERSRYELRMGDDLAGVADYFMVDGRVVFPHTEIVPARRGLGLGERLVRYALEDVRRTGMHVEARCWFVAEFIDLNPEFADLVA